MISPGTELDQGKRFPLEISSVIISYMYYTLTLPRERSVNFQVTWLKKKKNVHKKKFVSTVTFENFVPCPDVIRFT